MPDEATVPCPVCGSMNKPGARFCADCGIKLDIAAKIADEKPAAQEPSPELEGLLKDMLDQEIKTSEAAKDEDNIDDLLDSLVISEETKCPLCGAAVAAGNDLCPECGHELVTRKEEEPFAEDLEKELEKLATAVEKREAEPAKAAPAPAQATPMKAAPSAMPKAAPAQAPPFKAVPPVSPEAPPVQAPPARAAPPSKPGAPAPRREAPSPKPEAKPVVQATLKKAETPAPKAKAAPAAAEPEEEFEGEISIDVTEDELPKVHIFGSRFVDIVVIVTVILIFGIFIGLGMYTWANFTGLNVAILFSIAGGGMGATWMLFRASTSAVAEGDRLLRDGKYAEALAHYNRAIRIESRPTGAWTSRGVALKRLGKYDEAMRSHNMAIKLSKRNEVALCNKADLLFRAGRYEDAIEYYERALEVRPKYAVAWNNKAIVLARLGKLDEANSAESMAIKIRPKYAAAWINKGQIMAKLGRTNEAKVCYQRARTLTS
ncbi:MAG: tetratricopeptide repeat protein [Euryarchaeota archaeon]|nr:tetratricopeptide repeat protein [Euryarchaeota archaeon]